MTHEQKIEINRRSGPKMIAEKLFEKYPDNMPKYEEYQDLVYDYLPHLLSALQEVTLSDDIDVYRGVVGGLPVHNITSATIDKNVASEIINNRDMNGTQTATVYKIKIPKGTPVICYTNNLLLGDDHKGFNDEQKEILFDANLLEFEVKNVESNDMVNAPGQHGTRNVNYITLEGTLKEEQKMHI